MILKLVNIVSWVLFFSIVVRAASLRITNISIPRRVVLGESATLECNWTANNKKIYSLKWYLGMEEFYRWTPAEDNPVQVFTLRAFDVDRQRSNRGKVVIRNLTRDAEGLMRCEISEEAPSFHTAVDTGTLEVVDMPDAPPLLSHMQPVYQMHREVRVNCTSRNSKPAPSLSFFINNEPVNPGWVYPSQQTRVHYKDVTLFTTTRELRFRLVPRLMGPDGRVMIKCTAEIPEVYYDSSEVELPVDQPQRASVMEERASSVSRCCAGLASSVLPLLLLWRLQYWQPTN